MSKLSIITINYNNLDGLKRTVESVINQTWQEFEYIIIDGGSTDGSAKYIESLKDNLDYWVSEKDSGVYNAMNKGIAKATGEYLLFLNSGDHLYNNFVLEKNHQFLEKVDLIYFNVEMNDLISSKIISFPKELQFSFLFHKALCHQSVLMRKKMFDDIGLYDESLKIVSDWKFIILALFRYNCSYLKIDKVLSTYYLDGLSSRTIEDMLKERNLVLMEYFSRYIEDYRAFEDYRTLMNNNTEILKTNRFKMLLEIEKSKTGMKIVSLFFRTYIFLFSKMKLKDVLK